MASEVSGLNIHFINFVQLFSAYDISYYFFLLDSDGRMKRLSGLWLMHVMDIMDGWNFVMIYCYFLKRESLG